MRHQDLTANHLLESFTYANSTARMAATGFVAGDVGRIAYQQDQGAYYRLTATTPAWVLGGSVENSDVAAQGSITAGTRTYLTGSSIQCGKLLVGSHFLWSVSMSKTAAGTGHSDFDIAIGSAGTTADTARVLFTGPTETAAIDTAVVMIDMHVRVVSASGIVAAVISWNDTGSPTTGYTVHAGFVASSAFDNTANNLFVGLCLTPGAADVTTLNRCNVLAWNIG